MNGDAKARAQACFAGIEASFSQTDPEWTDIVFSFSQDEV